MSGKFDELLSTALSDCLDEEIKAVDQMEKVQPSPEWKGAVLSLCKKENKRRFHFQRFLKRCAVFVLVFFSSASLLMLTAPEVRGAVQQVILKWTDKALFFNFNGSSMFSDVVSVNATFIPSGYVLTDTFDALPDDFSYTWTNNEGQEIYLSCFKISQGAAQLIDNEHGELADISFSAPDIVYIKSNISGYPNYLSWTKDGYSILLETPKEFSEEAIIKIAEGIQFTFKGE